MLLSVLYDSMFSMRRYLAIGFGKVFLDVRDQYISPPNMYPIMSAASVVDSGIMIGAIYSQAIPAIAHKNRVGAKRPTLNRSTLKTALEIPNKANGAMMSVK